MKKQTSLPSSSPFGSALGTLPMLK